MLMVSGTVLELELESGLKGGKGKSETGSGGKWERGFEELERERG